MSTLTKEQQDIINAPIDINMCIQAGPGSGKTTTILHRIFHLVTDCDIPISSIALFTYNRTLGEDMRNKLSKMGLKSKKIGWCGTIHAFCFMDTRNHSDLYPWIQKYELKQSQEEYRASKFKYVIFDEFQDADKDISDVIKILSQNAYLTIVGDDRQQLYSYRGSNSDLMKSLKSDFVYYTLSQSFRCNQSVCEFLSRLSMILSKITSRSSVGQSLTRGQDEYTNITSNIPGPRPKIFRSRGHCMNNPKITDEIIKIVKNLGDESLAIISPTVNSSVSKRFLNDIHSNIYQKCGILFESYYEDEAVDRKMDGIYVMSSIHKVKGLEYDNVIILNVIDSKYFFDAPTAAALCKLFVGCSRLRKNLYIFEHQFHISNGSLAWLVDNDDLFSHDTNLYWNQTIQVRKNRDGEMMRTVKELLRTLPPIDRRSLLGEYSEPEIIGSEDGLGSHVGVSCSCGNLNEDSSEDSISDFDTEVDYLDLSDHNEVRIAQQEYEVISAEEDAQSEQECQCGSTTHGPLLSGQLIEILFALKYGHQPTFDIKPVITADEWHLIARSKNIPESIFDKAKQMYGKDVRVTRVVEFSKVIIQIIYLDVNKDLSKLIGLSREELTKKLIHTTEINKDSVVSDMMCETYYKHVDRAIRLAKEIKVGREINGKLIRDIWWLLKFQRLQSLSLIGFKSANLSDSEVDALLTYIESTTILSNYHITDYHSSYIRTIKTTADTLSVYGEPDFELSNGFLEMKCTLGEINDDMWLQVILYNQLAVDDKRQKYKDVYIYNVINGTLYKRTLV